MRSSFFVLWMFALLPAGSINASEDGLRVPSLGMIHDRERAVLRSITGVLGAAVVAPGVPPGFEVSQIAISNELRFALATCASDGLVRLIRTTTEATTEPQILTGAMTASDRIVLSPSGTAAILHSSKLSLLQVVSGLPGNPAVEGEFSTAALGDAVADPAVSDDGKEILFPGASLWRIDMRTASPRVVGGRAAAVSFRNHSHEAIAISQTGDVHRLENDTATLIATAGHSDPVAARVSRDGARAYVAFADGTLATVMLSGGGVKVLSCGCRPSGLDRVNSDVFRVTADPSSPLLFFDASQAEPRMRFVPAAEADVRESAR